MGMRWRPATSVVALVIVSAACGRGGDPAGPPRNLVVISLDTTRADHLGCYGHPAQATPNIDAVAREATVFTRAVSSNPLTAPAHSTMFTGTSPLVHGLHRNNLRLDDANVTIAERLRAQGMRTGAVVGAVVLDAEFGLAQGFDDYHDDFREQRHAGTHRYAERRAEEVSDEAIAWLEAHGSRPFFLFVHYFDPHAPYEPPEPFASRYRQDAYLGEIAYTDQQVGRVFAALRQLGLWDSTVVVVTADHGESLGAHGESTHGYYAYNATLHVPLLIRVPGRPAARLDDVVGLVDLVPTLLGALGMAIPEDLDGRDMSGRIGGQGAAAPTRALYFESFEPTSMGCGPIRGVVENTWKLIVTRAPELYDLERDWSETTNVIEAAPAQRERLAGILHGLRTAAAGRSHPSTRPGVNDATAARLRALGYVTDAPMIVGGDDEASLDEARQCFGAFLSYLAARAAVDEQRFDVARSALEQALAQRPNAWSALLLLGAVSVKQQRFHDAVTQLSAFLQGIGGEHAPADLADARGRAMTNLGVALHRLGRAEEALAHLNRAAELTPGFAESRNNFGNALLELGRYEEAAREFRAALAADARLTAAQRNLARALVAAGDIAEGIRAYRQALEAEPHAEACNELAWLLATCSESDLAEPAEAMRLAERCLHLAGARSADLLDTLAAAQAAAGRFAEARGTAEEALHLARQRGESELAREIETRLAGYRRDEAHRHACAAPAR